ncbi:MAG: hypothetical protein K8F25_03485 [Fimbriimonadaceae bacterium]|nr:hypothetical protein [Alphaproteobacteria bacterium]
MALANRQIFVLSSNPSGFDLCALTATYQGMHFSIIDQQSLSPVELTSHIGPADLVFAGDGPFRTDDRFLNALKPET